MIDKRIEKSPSVTEIRAILVVQYLEVSVKRNEFDEIAISTRDFRNFMINGVPEEFRLENFRNIRKVKRDVFKTATKLFKDKVFLIQSDEGNKELRLVLKS
jgi:hypothetical protein